MSKSKLTRRSASRSTNKKTGKQRHAVQSAALKSAKHKTVVRQAVSRRDQLSLEQAGRSDSKKAQVIAMLQSPSGATVEAMMRATGWQHHSVRGFLTGVIRKKLGLNLVSEQFEEGRIYRIRDGLAPSSPTQKTSRAA